MLESAFHRFGPFIIVRTLGRGGMGEVFIARTPWDENPLAAVKRLRPDVARVPTFAERFKHEAELAVRLDHPNVVGTLDVGSVEGQLYVCSDLVLGKDAGMIADRLRERGQGGPAAVAIRLLIDALAGLAYVHGVREPDGRPLQLVHRDVTPGNVLIGYDGIARLADFGLAKSLLTERAQLTNHGEILGTPHYLAPEVIRGEGASPASDLYGLGAVMYRFLTGVAPHQGTTAEVLLKVLSEQPRPLSDLRPDLPAWIVGFIHRMLDGEPARRPFDAASLLKQLQHDARASGLLVPRTSVSRWIGTLFEAEKSEELEERDRIAAIRPDAIPDKPEGTVVLAHPRAGSRLEAPASMPEPEEDVDSQGTELELSENDIRAFVTSEDRAPPIMKRRPGLDKPDFEAPSIPSDVTDAAAKRIDLDRVSFDDDSIEGMPTRAVAVFPGLLGPSPKNGGPETRERPLLDPANTGLRENGREDDTLDPQMLGKAKAAITADDNETIDTRLPGWDAGQKDKTPESGAPAGHLPGFVDDAPKRPPTRAPQAPSMSPPLTDPGERRAKLEVVPARPQLSTPAKRSTKSGGGQDTIPAPGPKPPVRERPSGTGLGGPRPEVEINANRHSTPGSPALPKDQVVPVKPHGATNPKAAATAVSSGQARAHRPQPQGAGVGKNLLVLVALLAIAIMMGVGIGVLVASLKRPPQIIVDTNPLTLLKERLLRLKEELHVRTQRGETVPPHAWELVATAGIAISDNDEARAEANIAELERLLGRSKE